MKKTITATGMALVFVCTMVLLFSSCSMFRSVGSYFFSMGSGQAPLSGNIAGIGKDSQSHYKMGCVFQERKRHLLAIEEFKRAVAADPDNVAAYNAMGVSMDAMGDHDRAVSAYQAALNVEPNSGYVLNNLGYCYLLEGKPELAIKSFKKAVAIDGKNRRYQNNLGLAYAKAGKYDAAFQAFKAGGGEANAQFNIARLYYQNGLYAEARTHFAQAAALKPSDKEISRGLVAATGLSEIHANTKNALEKKSRTVAGNEKANGYDKDGFSTIPAGAIKHFKIVETVLVEPANVKKNDSIQKQPVPLYTVATVRMADPKATEAAARVLKTKALKNLDESQTKKQLNPQDTGLLSSHGIKIEVSNGNGVARMARRVGNFLKGKGFLLMYLSNAKNFNYSKTSIYYTRGHLQEALQMAKDIPGKQHMEEVPILRGGHADISILIGKDLAPYLNVFQQG